MANADSSEIVKHLRAVHFSLTLACVLAFISLKGSSSSPVKTAHDQLQTVLSIKDNWTTWTQAFGTEQITWLKQHRLAWPNKVVGEIHVAAKELQKKDLPQSEHGWTARPIHSPIYFYLVIDHPASSRRDINIIGHGWPREDSTQIIPVNPVLVTLDDFQRFWDAGNNVQAFIVMDLSDFAYIVSNGKIEIQLPWIKPPSPSQGPQVELERIGQGTIGKEKCEPLGELLSSEWRPKFNVLFCGLAPPRPNQPPQQLLVLPAKYRDQPLPTNLRVWLAKHFGFSAVGKFDQSFPELNEVTKYYKELKLENVKRVLESELQRTGERVHFLGLEFPEQLIATWGTFIIISIQMYFWLHLKTLSTRLGQEDPGLKFPWIGLYPGYLARLTSFLSASMLPLALTLYLIHETEGFLLRSIPYVSFGVSAIEVWLALHTAVLQQKIIGHVTRTSRD